MPKWSHYLDDEDSDRPTQRVEKIRKNNRHSEENRRPEPKKDKTYPVQPFIRPK